MQDYVLMSLKCERGASGQRSNIEDVGQALGVVLGVAEVAPDAELPAVGDVEGGGGREEAPRDRLGVVAVVGGIGVATGDGKQVGWAAGRGEADAVVGGGRRGGRTTEEFLPPGSAVGVVGVGVVGYRGGGVVAEARKEDEQPALVLFSPLAPDPEEEEEEVGEEWNGPEHDGPPNVDLGVCGDINGGYRVNAVEVEVSVFPRYPRVDGVVDSCVQNHEETEWEGNSELDGREAHEAEVVIGIKVRDIQVEELLERISAFEKGAKGEDSVDAGDEGEDARPYPDK